MARYGKKSLSLLLTLVLLLGLLTGLGMQVSAAELPAYTADGTMTELSSGAKTAAGAYSIADAAELQALSAWVNAGNTGEGFTFFLTADVDLGGEASPWIPIGQGESPDMALEERTNFKGLFDGCGHAVTGLWIGGEAYTTMDGIHKEANGLVGVNEGTVQNLIVEAEIHTMRCGAPIAGHNKGTVKNCIGRGSVSESSRGSTRGPGGIVGDNAGLVADCISSCTVYNDQERAGGIAGFNTGSIESCFFVGSASSKLDNKYAGGVTSINQGAIKNCFWLEGSVPGDLGYSDSTDVPGTAENVSTFDMEGKLSGTDTPLLTALASDSFTAGTPFPTLAWAPAAAIGGGEAAPAEEAEAAKLSVFGAEVGLDALKAFETGKTLTHAKKGEVEVKGITATDLIEKIGGGSAELTVSLTFTASDGFSATVEKPEAGWDDVMLIWDGNGASDENLMSAVNGGGGKMWVSGVITVTMVKAAVICNGEPVTLAALKAFETEKTLVKAGKNGDTEVEVKGITAADLITKVMGSSAELTVSLTFTASDGFTATVEKPEAGWDDVMLIWEGGSASDDNLMSAVNGGGGKMWVSGVITVEAVGGKEVCLAVCLKNGKDGEAVLLKEYDKAELQAMAGKNEAGWAYLYYKGEAWASIVATEVVELDALLADAGAAESWVSGSWLEFTCSDGVYGKSYPGYDDIAAKNLFVGEDGSSLVPAGLAITWNSGVLEPVTAESVAALAATAYDSGSLRFVYGMTEAQFTDESNRPAGARMPTGVLILTVVTGEEASEGTVGTSKDDSLFTDIAGTWAEADILAAAKLGLVNGMGNGLFQPETSLSRAMMAQILYRVVGEPKLGGVSFEDATADNWYYAAASWAVKTGIVSDFIGDRFEGSKAITREEIAAMLYRCAALFGLDTGARADLSAYSDAGEVSDWAKDAVSWAVATGIMEGRPGNLIAPAGTATRAEAVTLLMRVMRTVPGR